MPLAFKTVPIALAFLLATGCGDKRPATHEAEEKLHDAEKSRDEAAKAVRAEYIHEAGERLSAFDTKLKALGERVTTATGQAKIDLEKKYAETKSRRDTAAEKLHELKDANADRWEKVKDATGSAFEDLKKAFE